MALDQMQGHEFTLNAPSHRWVLITPDDANDLVHVPKFIKIGATGGTIRMHGKDGVAVTMTVVAGEKLECRPHRIYLTGTSATTITACY
jgi:hypothetical protein